MSETNTQQFTEVCRECGTAFSLLDSQCLADVQTANQRIQVYATGKFGHAMMIDSCIMLTSRDNYIYHEMLVHPALYSHPRPQQVVIIGGGDCGSLREVLRHDVVERVTQVELDEAVTRHSERYFPELCASNDDPRAELVFGDGIEWLANVPTGSVDVIIVDSTDPIGPAEGLFRAPFFGDCRRALRGHGLLVQQSESPFFHIDSVIRPMHRAMREAGFETVKLFHFPQPTYPSGWWSVSIATNGADLNFVREAQAAAECDRYEYYHPAIHRAAQVLPQTIARKLAG